MSVLKLFLLGSPRVELDGAPVDINRRKALALLIYLAITGRLHGRDTLAAMFYPDHNQQRARAYLRRDLAVLNMSLGGEWLQTDGDTVALKPDFWLDVAHFSSLVAGCKDGSGPDSGCLEPLVEAVALYTADFLAGFSLRDSAEFDDWQFFQAESLRQELGQALELLVQALFARQAYAEAVPYARRWVALDPLHEPAQRRLIQIYDLAGQPAAALRQYEEYVALLEQELGLPPEEETLTLVEAVKARRLFGSFLHEEQRRGRSGPTTAPAPPRPATRDAKRTEGPRPELQPDAERVEGPRPEFIEGPRPELQPDAERVEGPRPEFIEGPHIAQQNATQHLRRWAGVPGPDAERVEGFIEGSRPELYPGVERAGGPRPDAERVEGFIEGVPAGTAGLVARQQEMARLDGFLRAALSGQTGVVFITGDAGQGKTSLLQAFAGQAQQAHPELVVAGGNCIAYTGVGDPYLPFRAILELLTGDVEARRAAGALTGDQARRLAQVLPLAAQALVETGPDLLDTFVPIRGLLARAAPVAGPAPWLAELQELARTFPPLGGAGRPESTGRQQMHLFEQYAQVIQRLARSAPVLLLLDDLQWADTGSADLLFHLGRELSGHRVLIVGAYRPAEVALGRAAPQLSSGEAGPPARHPLERVINEFQRQFGDIFIDLSQVEGRAFVEALLDSEPNRLGPVFRDTLHRQTEGHPLFTIELLRSMQERGDLVRDPDGYWQERPSLDWQTLPARVEGVIGERIQRLPAQLRELLQVASVEGEVFTAELVAQVLNLDSAEVVRRLSQELDRLHQLVWPVGLKRVGTLRLSRYRFRHILIQRYLYHSLDEMERAYLNESIGNALEQLYSGQTEQGAVQLAWYFQEAGLPHKAAAYLKQAGGRARRLLANEEAITHFTQALKLLQTLPAAAERWQLELEVLIAMGPALMLLKGHAAPEVEQAYARAYDLCRRLGTSTEQAQNLASPVQAQNLASPVQAQNLASPEQTQNLASPVQAQNLASPVQAQNLASLLFPVLWGLWRVNLNRANLRTALELGHDCLDLAVAQQNQALLVEAHIALGTTLAYMGKSIEASIYFEQGKQLYEPQRHHMLPFLYGGFDPKVYCLSYEPAFALWMLGHPDQALRRSQEALQLARELDHPYSLAFALSFVGLFFQFQRDAAMVRQLAEESIALCNEHGFTTFLGMNTALCGWARVEQGDPAGLDQLQQGLVIYQRPQAVLALSYFQGLLAQAQLKLGQIEAGLATVDRALALAQEHDERFWEAELLRLKGELLLAAGARSGETASPEDCFSQAIQTARQQSAKVLELRAAASLGRLLLAGGKKATARRRLKEAYTWFNEGFDTPDLQAARALLEEMERT